MDDPDLNGQMIASRWSAVTPPRCALLESHVARAALHCGIRKGAKRLIGYLSDSRKVFAKMARRALSEALGADFGMDGTDWLRYIESLAALPVTPYRGNPYCG